MKTTLTPLNPADFIGPAPVSEPDPPQDLSSPPSRELGGPDFGGPDIGGPEVKNAGLDNVDIDADVLDDEAASGESADSEEPAKERYIGPRVKLTVEIDAETFDADVNAAFRQLAREVRIPGFRPGRAPRRVLEAHFGPEIGRAQALEEAVPRYYAEAVRDNLLDVVNQPELELTLDGSEGPVAFDAVVEVRPLVSVAGYENLQIEIPSPVPSDEQIEARIDQTRRQFANIIEVDRPAALGDRVTVDIEGSVDSVALPGLSAQDYLYELGSGGIVPEVDEYLTNCVAGDDVSFSAPHPTQPDMEIDFEITVGAVSELVLPELTDEWVDENTEHDTIADMREATAQQLRFGQIMQANMALREEAQRELAGLVEGPVPDSLISGAIADQMSELGNGLQQRNMTIEEWLEATGQAPEEFVTELRDNAERSVRLDLALRAVAAEQSLQADEEDIDAELERLTTTEDRDADQLREEMAEADGLARLKSAICKSKALNWAIEAATLVGPDGETVERSALEFPKPDSALADDVPTEGDSADDSRDLSDDHS